MPDPIAKKEERSVASSNELIGLANNKALNNTISAPQYQANVKPLPPLELKKAQGNLEKAATGFRPEDPKAKQTLFAAATALYGTQQGASFYDDFLKKRQDHLDQNANDSFKTGDTKTGTLLADESRKNIDARADAKETDDKGQIRTKDSMQSESLVKMGDGLNETQKADMLAAAAAVGFSVVAISMAGSELFAGQQVAERNAQEMLLQDLQTRMTNVSEQTRASLEKHQNGKWRSKKDEEDYERHYAEMSKFLGKEPETKGTPEERYEKLIHSVSKDYVNFVGLMYMDPGSLVPRKVEGRFA